MKCEALYFLVVSYDVSGDWTFSLILVFKGQPIYKSNTQISCSEMKRPGISVFKVPSPCNN